MCLAHLALAKACPHHHEMVQRRTFGPFELDPEGSALLRDGAFVPIGRRGMAILEILMESGGAPVSKDALLDHAWPGVFVEESNLSVQIAALRKALGPGPSGSEWIITVPRFGYRLFQPPPPAVPSSPKPVLAVLPFEALSPSLDDAWFTEGVVDDIIVSLSRFRSFAVIGRNTTAPLREQGLSLDELGVRLGVRYALEGSVRRAGDRLRVAVQLLDAATATSLWADRFDGDTAGIFAFQDTVAAAVAGIVEPHLRRAEIERSYRQHARSTAAYDLYLRSLPHFRGTTSEHRSTAIRLLEDAVAADPAYATGLAHAAWAYERQDTFGEGMTAAERARALELAEAALVADPDDPQVMAIAALVLLNVGRDRKRALAILDVALGGNPNSLTVLSLHGFANVMAGDLAAGRRSFLSAVTLAAGAPDSYEIVLGVGIADLLGGDAEGCLDWAQRSLALNPAWAAGYWILAAAYAHHERLDEAREAIAKLTAIVPEISVADVARLGMRYSDRFGVVVDGVRRAGLRE
jgi:TolB-like protein/DNA-binding winged helix-turn-helix (wHTH) protein